MVFEALDILSIIVGGVVDYSGAGWSLYEIRVPVIEGLSVPFETNQRSVCL